jgi:hypothetical protein
MFLFFNTMNFYIISYFSWKKEIYEFSKEKFFENREDLSNYESKYYIKIKS